MELKVSKNSFFNYLIMIVFAVLIPVQEWPDTSVHFERKTFYSQFILNFSQLLDIPYPKFLASENFSFFSDTYIYQTYRGDSLINLIKLIFIIPLFLTLNRFSLSLINEKLPFSPPLIFALLIPSLEPFAIALIIISFLYIKSGKIFTGAILGFIATIIDRSMVPSLVGIIILACIYSFNDKKKFYILIITSIFLLILFFYNLTLLTQSPMDRILNYYGISQGDINYNVQFGQKNIYALIASLSGLYGWMSLRPFPWFFYYGIIIVCFLIGFIKSSKEKKVQLFIFLIPTMIVLYILPPLSQARYYPILILLYWENILLGTKYILKKDEFVLFVITFMTIVGLYFV